MEPPGQDRIHRLALGPQDERGACLRLGRGPRRRSVEVGREVIRFNPLGRNEGASAEAQLWVLMAQVQQELELAGQADILVTDRSVVDNFAYFLRVTDGADPFGVEPLVRRWAQTYDLVVRLLPDVALLPDGVRSTNDAFRDEIEAILDRIVPDLRGRGPMRAAARQPGHRGLRLDGAWRAAGADRRAAAARPAAGAGRASTSRPMDDSERTLRRAAELSLAFLDGLAERHVGPRTDGNTIAAALGGPLPEDGEDPVAVIEDMARAARPGPGGDGRTALLRFRDRRRPPGRPGRGLADRGLGPERQPARALPGGCRRRAGGRRLDARPARIALVGQRGPADGCRALPTRSAWRPVGTPSWRVRDGTSRRAACTGHRRSRCVMGEEAHATVLTALQYLGPGPRAGGQGPGRWAGTHAGRCACGAWSRTSAGPLLLVTQAGNVNTGGFDPLPAIADVASGPFRMPGSMSTGRSDCGPRPRRGCGTWSTASTGGLLGDRCPQVAEPGI